MKGELFPMWAAQVRAFVCLAALFSASTLAQEKPLGDTAREAQAQKVPPSRPARVLTDDQSNGPMITSNDDPIDVFNKSRAALLRERSHRCVTEASGNSGPAPGWAHVTTVEIAPGDRTRFTDAQTSPDSHRSEWILIKDVYYLREDDGPWRKFSAPEPGLTGKFRLPDSLLPDELQFGYKSGDLKLIGSEVVDGASALQLQYDVHSSAMEMDRTVNIWVGINDYLPRKLNMVTFDRRDKISDRQQTTCSVGVNIAIEPPI
jgi:hypothetical protein